jgi:hypothetical protein
MMGEKGLAVALDVAGEGNISYERIELWMHQVLYESYKAYLRAF